MGTIMTCATPQEAMEMAEVTVYTACARNRWLLCPEARVLSSYISVYMHMIHHTHVLDAGEMVVCSIGEMSLGSTDTIIAPTRFFGQLNIRQLEDISLVALYPYNLDVRHRYRSIYFHGVSEGDVLAFDDLMAEWDGTIYTMY